MNSGKTTAIALLFTLLLTAFGYTAQVKKHPDSQLNLEKRWDWAKKETRGNKKGFWIGYSFRRLAGVNCYIGSHYSCGKYKPTLEMILEGKTSTTDGKDSSETVKGAAKRALCHMDNKRFTEEKILKDAAVLFYYESGSDDTKNLDQISISDLSLYFDLEDKPLYWLGLAPQEESMEFLKKIYEKISYTENKEDLVTIIGLHSLKKEVHEFLVTAIKSDAHADIRENAVFWLGNQDTKEGLDILLDVVKNDRSEDVREQAVFAISVNEQPEATEALIKLAKEDENYEVRKKAIFWLGQKASKECEKFLTDIVYNDDDTDIQNQAVFALSQLDDNDGIPALIKVAKEHQSLEVRKKAIFWLGESGDPRALETIIDIIKKKK